VTSVVWHMMALACLVVLGVSTWQLLSGAAQPWPALFLVSLVGVVGAMLFGGRDGWDAVKKGFDWLAEIFWWWP